MTWFPFHDVAIELTLKIDSSDNYHNFSLHLLLPFHKDCNGKRVTVFGVRSGHAVGKVNEYILTFRVDTVITCKFELTSDQWFHLYAGNLRF